MVQNRNKATCGVKNDTADIISNVTEATFFRIEGFNSLAFVSRIKAGVTKDRIKKNTNGRYSSETNCSQRTLRSGGSNLIFLRLVLTRGMYKKLF